MRAIRTQHLLADSLRLFGPAAIITVAGFLIAYQFIDPAPPRQLTLATGGEHGAYHAFGRRYQEILARHEVVVHLRNTDGSVENLKLLTTSTAGIDVAFVQGGTGERIASEDIRSLGSVYFEPLWVFLRPGLSVRRLGDLRGKRIAAGPDGSGTRAVTLRLLADNALSGDLVTVLPAGGPAAAAALTQGEIDAAFFVASPESLPVQRLLRAPDAALMNFERADAYTRRHRFLSKLRLPEGVIDLEENIPPRDVVLLAPTANLVARRELHPALVGLLLQAAQEVHGPGALFQSRGEFPAPSYLEFPLSEDARHFYESGPPFLQRFLPFWAANLVDRLKIMLVPLLALLFPLVKIMPPVYRWRVRSRIYRWYRELQAVEFEHREVGQKSTRLAQRLAELDRIEAEVTQISIPASYAHELYNLRFHLDRVRDRFQRSAALH